MLVWAKYYSLDVVENVPDSYIKVRVLRLNWIVDVLIGMQLA